MPALAAPKCPVSAGYAFAYIHRNDRTPHTEQDKTPHTVAEHSLTQRPTEQAVGPIELRWPPCQFRRFRKDIKGLRLA